MAEGIQIKNLPSTTAIKQGDTMTIVQDKQNKQLALDVFANESDLATLSPLENRCDEVKAKIEVDEYSAEITTSQSMSKIGSGDSGVDLHENVLDGAFESCVLKGKTKYRDIDTGEILEDFEEGRNLELITVRMPILTTSQYPTKPIQDGLVCWLEASDIKNGDLMWKDKTNNNNNATLTGFTGDCFVDGYLKMKKGAKISLPTQLQYSTVQCVFAEDKINNYQIDIIGTTPKTMRFCMRSGDYHPYYTNIKDIAFNNTDSVLESKKSIVNYVQNNMIKNSDSIFLHLECSLDNELHQNTTIGCDTNSGAETKFKTILIYNRRLTKEERLHNYEYTRGIELENKTSILSFNQKDDKTIVLRSLPDGTCDTLNVETGEYVQKIGERNCQDGDTNSNTLVTDGTKTHYKLSSPIITKVDVQGFPHAYKNGHIQLSSGSTEPSLTPTVTYKVPVSRVGQIASNTKSNLRQTIKLDQLEILAYQSLINAEYENLLVQNSAESAASFTNLSTNDPKDELYYMLKHLIEENQPVQNMLDKINLFYLYGLLSDEHYFDLLLGGEEDVY